ncbi:hypothetical protein WH5701_05770 [Synechococcus sp. WH 5701]|nr:hypothetical protein WH5701_05770 [Synechococcus sp. WH 5701]
MGAQAAEQLHRLEQVRLAFPVGADHQQTRLSELERELGVVAKIEQLQAMQPNGSGATCG